MDELGRDLIETLQTQRTESLRGAMNRLRFLLRYVDHFNPVQQQEYDSIEKALDERRTTFTQAVAELEMLERQSLEGQIISKDTQREYAARIIAVMEKDKEVFNDLQDRIQRLLVEVVAMD